MKNLQSKRLYAFIVSALIFSVSTYAQIVYTDINPDVSVARTRLNQRGIVSIEHSLDINNDGISDLKFTLSSSNISGFAPGSSSSVTGSVTATPLNGGAFLTDSLGNPVKLNLNQSIRANANWSTVAKQLIISKARLTPVSVPPTVPSSTFITKGNWSTTTDGFLGFRFVVAGKTHYCWIRLNAGAFSSGPTAATMVIKDYAYNSKSNSRILAGQTITTKPILSTAREATSTTEAPTEEAFFSAPSPSLYPNPAVDKFTVDLGGFNRNVDLTIFDLKGKIVYSKSEAETQRMEVNTSSFEKGIYVVQIRTEDFSETKRLVVSK